MKPFNLKILKFQLKAFFSSRRLWLAALIDTYFLPIDGATFAILPMSFVDNII